MEAKIIVPLANNFSIDDLDYSWTEDYPAISTDSEFVPIHALTNGEVFSTSINKTLIYSLQTLIEGIDNIRKFGEFCDYMVGYTGYRYNYWASLLNPTINKKYSATTGLIVNYDLGAFKPYPLLVMCMKKEYLFKQRTTEEKLNPNPDEFILVIDRKFITDEEHFKLYRNVKKYYIDEMEKIVDVVYTNNILRACYNNNDNPPVFNTVNESIEYANTIGHELILMD